MPLDTTMRTSLQRQIGRLLIMLVSVTAAGTLGYMVLEDWGLAESLYMTVITLSTVGFSEVHELTPVGRLFTTLLIVVGVGIVAYVFGSIGQYLISGELRGTIRRRRMQRAARKSTRAYGEVGGPGGPAFGIHVSNQGRFMIVAGGLPVFVDEQIVAGIGCSSGSPDQDEVVAQAGIDALLSSLT